MRAHLPPQQRVTLAALALAAAVVPAFACAAPPPIIPRETLFSPADHLEPVLSPDGHMVAYVAPAPSGIPEIWVKSVGKADDHAVSTLVHTGLRSLRWAHDGRTLMFESDLDATGSWHVYGLDVPSGNVRDFTPFVGVSARVLALSDAKPGEMLVQMNLRDRKAADVYRVALGSGAIAPDTEAAPEVQRFIADRDLRVRAVVLTTPTGGIDVRARADDRSLWAPFALAAGSDVLDVYQFTDDGKAIVLGSSLGADTARIVAKDVATGAEKVLAQSPDADAEGVMADPYTGKVEAAAFSPDRRRWVAIDPAVKADLAALSSVVDGDFAVVSRDKANKLWLVAYDVSNGPARFYLWDRATKKSELLFTSTKKLEGLALATTRAVSFKARDGLALRGFLTVPVGGGKKLPLVLLVHDGPWARDHWGYDPEVQWLANRGYACLQVGYRGSTGYGRKHLEAGYKQWGRAMQNDLADAVRWAVDQGIADPKRVAISGTSYGGYAALAAAGLTPELFAAAIDVVGPTSLEVLVRSIPERWAAARSTFLARVGNPEDAADRDQLAAVSPLGFASRIKTPVLIAQGGDDPHAPAADTEKVVAAIDKGAVTYVVYKDEAHGLARLPNRLDFMARAEAFLAKYLGGRVEPLAGEKQPGSTAAVAVSR